MTLGAILGLVVGVGIGLVTAIVYLRQQQKRQLSGAESARTNIIAEAENAGREIVLKARDEAITIRDEAEKESNRRRRELEKQQEQLTERREKLDERLEQTDNRARNLEQREQRVNERERELQEIEARANAELERVAVMTREEAREEVLASVAVSARADSARIIRDIEQAAKAEGEKRAREIVITCIQRCATDIVSDIVSSTVVLPSDDMKGRIIGRQGRNIRAFELASGVDVIVDDTPEAIVLSCFDPVRREIGRRSMETLITDGRIHPGRIEQIVKKAKEDVEKTMREAGEEAAFDAGVRSLHPELIKLMGRMKYRTSYGQNVLAHSVETAHLAAMLANEVGADVDIARLGGFLHDIGKAVSHEVEGPHALIGADLAQRYGVTPIVVNTIAAHHHEAEQESLEAVLVETADAISGARPGARRESLELYIKRIKALENIAQSYRGVEESFAIQAGREVRVFVRPDEIDDLSSLQLARDIAQKIEETLEYPGQVKVTVIRETRVSEIAK
jgi:ribonuclease Y